MAKKRGPEYMHVGAMAFEAIATSDKDFIVSPPNRKTSGIPPQRSRSVEKEE